MDSKSRGRIDGMVRNLFDTVSTLPVPNDLYESILEAWSVDDLRFAGDLTKLAWAGPTAPPHNAMH